MEFSRRRGLYEGPLLEAAFRQKIGALSGRAVTQARDVFDLKLLLDSGAGREKLPAVVAKEIPKAIENATTIGFDELSGRVGAYLTDDYQEYYGSRKVWEGLQQEVVDVWKVRAPRLHSNGEFCASAGSEFRE